jgi:putative intracellular protease/amidase
MTPLNILLIATSNDKIGDTIHQTGVWLEEIASPYYLFNAAGAQLTIASPKGGEVPVDPKSMSILVASQYSKRFLKDEEAMHFLSHSKSLEEINAEDFDAIYVSGGLGPLWDMADNALLKNLLETFNHQNKPMGLICHGVVALLSLKNEAGEPLVQGKQVTGFSNTEETSGIRAGVVPLLVETELILLGAQYSKTENYLSHVVVDGNLITGQNPASSEGVAKKILFAAEDRKHSLQVSPAMTI